MSIFSRYRLGTQLHPDDRRYVLAAYVHRRMNLQYTTDEAWLAATKFAVKKDGRLDRRYHFCECSYEGES